MSVADAYLSLEGRIDRRRWLLLVAVLLAVVQATAWGTGRFEERGALDAQSGAALRVFVEALVFVPWFALDVKRFHDLGQPGFLAALCPGLFVLSKAWEYQVVRTALPETLYASGATTLAAAQLGLALSLAVTLPFIRGTEGDNRYGPDPLAGRVAGTGSADTTP